MNKRKTHTKAPNKYRVGDPGTPVAAKRASVSLFRC